MRTLFAVSAVAGSNSGALATKISTDFPTDSLAVGTGGPWLIVTDGTAKDLSDKLGISDGSTSTAIVLATSGYFGRAPNNIWEWIAARLKAPTNA